MFGYGALVDSSIGDRLHQAWQSTLALLGNLSFHWYAIIAAMVFLLYLLLIRK